VAAQLRVNEACDRFEDAWLAGQRPALEQFLSGVEGAERSELLRQLLRLELCSRRQAGEQPSAEEYRRRLPGHEQAVEALFAPPPSLPAPGGQPVHTERPFGAGRTPARSEAPAPGDVPPRAGRYRIEGEIARGGMGAILRAHDPELNRAQAVKVLLKELAGRPEVERRFLEEAQVAGRLQHPGVPPVHDVGRLDDGRPFFAMKLIQGRDLAELLEQQMCPAEELPHWLGVFEQVCQAVAYAHSKGVIHRDLKPANIMVGAFGEVQVMDWGLAKVLAGAGPGAGEAPEGNTLETARSGDDWPLSQPGSVLGTPAYMAPEQASGAPELVDERSDVFGLGAILCVILTGQPPYRGPDARCQARQADLADALARLESCGADEELVRLARACLCPQPEGRPRHGGAVAQAVADYQAGVSARLRQAELERAQAQARAQEARATAAAERRARRRALGLAAAVLLLALVGGGAGLWWGWQRAQQRRAVDAELELAAASLRDWNFPQARAALGRAQARLAGGAPAELSLRVQRLQDDLTLAGRLEDIRLKAATITDGKLGSSAARDYARVFRQYGLAEEGEDPQAVALRIQASPVCAQLVAALDFWAISTTAHARRAWLLEVARRAEPGAWSDSFRDPELWQKPAALKELALQADAAELSPPALMALTEVLKRVRGNWLPLLRAARERHPRDFWLNFLLANALHNAKKPEEAVGYYLVALAVRPNTSAVHNNLGLALKDKGDLKGAIACYQKAIALDPKLAAAHNNLGLGLLARKDVEGAVASLRRAVRLAPLRASAHSNLGLALHARGDLAGAIGCHRRALKIDPNSAKAHSNLGVALKARGDLNGAIACYRKAIRLDRKYAGAHSNLGLALCARKDLAGAIACFRQAIVVDPRDAQARCQLGNALHSRKDLAGAMACFRAAIDLDPRYAPAHINLGIILCEKKDLDGAIARFKKAISLDPRQAKAHANLGVVLRVKGDLKGATAAFRKAIAVNPRVAMTHNSLGVTLVARKDLKGAIVCFRKAIHLNPRCAEAHTSLGLALFDTGDLKGAATCYRKAILLDPSNALAHGALGQALLLQGEFTQARAVIRRCLALLSTQHPLRKPVSRQLQHCERLLDLEGRLTAVLAGLAEPRDTVERLNLADLAQQSYKRQYAVAVRLYSEAFADKDASAQLLALHRYNAARAAALAAAGQGNGAAELDARERAQLRQQALGWLKADLANWGNGPLSTRPPLQRTLLHWQKDPALAGVRDKEALAKLSQDERTRWRKLWADVAARLDRTKGHEGPRLRISR
jgi:tetratricopeptide (TPR) repeat protein